MEIAIKKLGDIITGNTPSKKKEKYWNSKDICFVKPDIIADEGITLIQDSSEYLSENARTKARVVSEDAVFVTCIGSIGKIGIAAPGNYAFNQQINVIVPNDKIVPRYLAYDLLFSKSKLETIANAPVVPIINKSQFGEFIIKIEENKTKQVEIVGILDKLSNIIAKRKNEIKELDTLIKSRFVEIFGDPVNNEMGWRTKALEDACKSIVDCPHSTPSYTSRDTGFMCIRTSIVKKNRIVWEEIEYIPEEEFNQRIQRKRPEKGDVIYTREGAILGIAAVIDRECNVALGQRSMLLSPDKAQCTPEFISVAMNFDTFLDSALKGISGSASPHINVGDIKAFQMILPPLEQQEAFSYFTAQVNKIKSAVQKSLDETQLLFDSLMQKYFG